MKGLLMLVAVVVIVDIVVVVIPTTAAQGLTPSQCNNQKQDIENTCRNVALKNRTPSAACCQLIRAANADCVCQFVKPKLFAAIGGADRTMRLVQSCGRAIPRHYQCGSMTTPF